MERQSKDEAEPVSVPRCLIPEVDRDKDTEEHREEGKEIVVPAQILVVRYFYILLMIILSYFRWNASTGSPLRSERSILRPISVT